MALATKQATKTIHYSHNSKYNDDIAWNEENRTYYQITQLVFRSLLAHRFPLGVSADEICRSSDKHCIIYWGRHTSSLHIRPHLKVVPPYSTRTISAYSVYFHSMVVFDNRSFTHERVVSSKNSMFENDVLTYPPRRSNISLRYGSGSRIC